MNMMTEENRGCLIAGGALLLILALIALLVAVFVVGGAVILGVAVKAFCAVTGCAP